jgi:hypothetical protein
MWYWPTSETSLPQPARVRSRKVESRRVTLGIIAVSLDEWKRPIDTADRNVCPTYLAFLPFFAMGRG